MLNPRDIALATQLIKSHQRILVVPHANVDPDCMSSALAVFQMLKTLGKDVTVICPETTPESLAFLPGVDRFSKQIEQSDNFVITINLDDGVEVDNLRYTVEDKRVNIIVVPKQGKISTSQISFGEGEKKYDLIIVVDSADLALLGSVYTEHVDLFTSIPLLNIDHHVSNTRFGDQALVVDTASSTCEVLYHFFTLNHVTIDASMALSLLTGLMYDTDNFTNGATSQRSLDIGSELVRRGADLSFVRHALFQNKTIPTLQLWGDVLARLIKVPERDLTYTYITQSDLKARTLEEKDAEGIANFLSNIGETTITLFFKELADGQVRASFRTTTDLVDVSLLAKRFGGGGHKKAAGFTIPGPMEQAIAQVLKTLGQTAAE